MLICSLYILVPDLHGIWAVEQLQLGCPHSRGKCPDGLYSSSLTTSYMTSGTTEGNSLMCVHLDSGLGSSEFLAYNSFPGHALEIHPVHAIAEEAIEVQLRGEGHSVEGVRMPS